MSGIVFGGVTKRFGEVTAVDDFTLSIDGSHQPRHKEGLSFRFREKRRRQPSGTTSTPVGLCHTMSAVSSPNMSSW